MLREKNPHIYKCQLFQGLRKSFPNDAAKSEGNLQKGYEAAKSSGVSFEPDRASHIQGGKKTKKKHRRNPSVWSLM